MACPAIVNVCRSRGDTYPEIFRLLVNGAVQNLTGYTNFKLSVHTIEDPPDLTTQEFELTGAIVSAPAGTYSFAPSAAQPVLAGNYFYDVQVTEPSGFIRTIQKGAWDVGQDKVKT